MKLSGYGHKKQLTKLFHTWLDCLTLQEPGAVAVCSLGDHLVSQRIVWLIVTSARGHFVDMVICVYIVSWMQHQEYYNVVPEGI